MSSFLDQSGCNQLKSFKCYGVWIVSVQSNEFKAYSSPFLLQRHIDVCGTALNAFVWNSFLTRCSFFLPFYSILVCVQYYLFLWYSVCRTVISDKDCQLIPPVYNVSFSHAYLYLTRLCSVKCILSLNKGFGYGSKLKSLGRQACVPTT